jgi:hypothetical protein
MELQCNDTERGKPKKLEKKVCSSATSPTTNPTFTALDVIAGLRSERPATNRLSYSTVLFKITVGIH